MSSGIVSSFRKLFGASEQKQVTSSLASPDLFTLGLFGSVPVASGVVVTPQTAMRCTAVRCAVQAIAEAIGQLPVHVYTMAPDGSRSRDRGSPVASLLNGAANDWTPSNEFREDLTRDALLYGNGYAFINRVESGRVVELTRLRPSAVSVTADLNTGELTYRADLGAGQTIIPRENVLHIRSPLVDVFSESTIHQAKEAIGLALVMEGHAARLFGRGARPSGLISFPSTLTPEGAANAKAAWQGAHGGQNGGGTAVLENGATWAPLALNSVDSQFLELRKFAIEEIARAFRVPPVLLMEYGRATWGNSEEMGRQFTGYCLLPWIKRWEGEVRLKLFPADERASSYAEFNVDDLLRADLAQRATAYSQLISSRVLNPNEVRERENLPPYAGGDQFLNPNTTTDTVTV